MLLKLSSDMKERIKTAVEFLRDGQSFKVGNLRLGMNSTHEMYVTGWSHYLNIANLTKHKALKELDEIKNLFGQMLQSSEELKRFILDKQITYNLAFDYGMGAIGICSEKNGKVEWETELKS